MTAYSSCRGIVIEPVLDGVGNPPHDMSDRRLPSSTIDVTDGSHLLLDDVGRSELTWTADKQGLPRDTRVLIIDDSRLYREYLAGVVAANGGPRPGVAWDLQTLIRAVGQSNPRVIILNTATRDSALLLRQALSMTPSARVVVLGLSEDDESEIVACAEAGVAGYHLRNESLEDLLALIRKVAAGESICSPKISAILLRRLSSLASQRQGGTEELVLTAREAQILKMLELGRSNKDIADELCIAVHTVKNHVHSLLTKLGVSSRAQAAARSRDFRCLGEDSRN